MFVGSGLRVRARLVRRSGVVYGKSSPQYAARAGPERGPTSTSGEKKDSVTTALNVVPSILRPIYTAPDPREGPPRRRARHNFRPGACGALSHAHTGRTVFGAVDLAISDAFVLEAL